MIGGMVLVQVQWLLRVAILSEYAILTCITIERKSRETGDERKRDSERRDSNITPNAIFFLVYLQGTVCD